MTHDLTISEFGDTVTGFDEIAVTQRFGRTLADMTTDFSMFARALVFTAKRREGATDDEAWTAAMELPFKDVSTFFAEVSEEDDSESAGKDEQPEPEPEPLPASSLISVS